MLEALHSIRDNYILKNFNKLIIKSTLHTLHATLSEYIHATDDVATFWIRNLLSTTLKQTHLIGNVFFFQNMIFGAIFEFTQSYCCNFVMTVKLVY